MLSLHLLQISLVYVNIAPELCTGPRLGQAGRVCLPFGNP
jgi:hypothetical protein